MLADFRIYFGKLAAEGKVPEPLVLMQVNDGMFLVRGDIEVIFDITGRDDFIVLVNKAMFVCEGFAMHMYFTGEKWIAGSACTGRRDRSSRAWRESERGTGQWSPCSPADHTSAPGTLGPTVSRAV